MKVYTNLNSEELFLLRKNISLPDKHQPSTANFSYLSYQHLDGLLAEESRSGRQLVFIQFERGHGGKLWAKLITAAIDKEAQGTPNFLGKVAEGRFLCDVLLT
jgi:hypothetical protein